MRKGCTLLCGLYPQATPTRLLDRAWDLGSSLRPAPAPPTWKTFCFSATRFSKRFRAVELKERTRAWETWQGREWMGVGDT